MSLKNTEKKKAIQARGEMITGVLGVKCLVIFGKLQLSEKRLLNSLTLVSDFLCTVMALLSQCLCLYSQLTPSFVVGYT